MTKKGLCIIPEEAPPKFFFQNFYPYYLVKKKATNKLILDIGFGDGYGASYLAEVAKRVIAIDCELENVINAKNKYPGNNLEFVLNDACELAFQESIFDVCCSFQVIEHIKEDRLLKYLHEIYRVIKPEGFLYLSTLNKEVTMKKGNPYFKNPFHLEEFNASELNELLLKVFKKVDMFGLQLTNRHRFFQRLKKIGLFRPFPDRINPVARFYKSVSIKDFKISKNNLRKSSDFISVCQK